MLVDRTLTTFILGKEVTFLSHVWWCLMPLSVISWQSVYWWRKLKKTPTNWKTLSHNVVQYTLPWLRFEFTTWVVIGTDCMGKSNYHIILAMTAPDFSFRELTGRSVRQQREVWQKLIAINRNIVWWPLWSHPAQI